MDKKDLIDSSFRGIFYKNPTHLKAAAQARDQSDIVKTVFKMKREIIHQQFLYNDETKQLVFPGIKKFKSLSDEEIDGVFNQIMRSRPNIFQLRICFGDYEEKDIREIYSNKITDIGSNRQLYPSEVGKRISEAFKNRDLNIIDFVYTVSNHEENSFSSSAQAFSVSKELYDNEELFNPVVEISYLSNN